MKILTAIRTLAARLAARLGVVILRKGADLLEEGEAIHSTYGEGHRSYEDGEHLTEFEVGFVSRGHCPDCEHEDLLAGPRGGMSQNFKCGSPVCGSRFNDMGPFGIDRISDPSPDRPPEGGNGSAYRSMYDPRR